MLGKDAGLLSRRICAGRADSECRRKSTPGGEQHRPPREARRSGWFWSGPGFRRDRLWLILLLVLPLPGLPLGACSKGSRSGAAGSTGGKAAAGRDLVANPPEAAKGWVPHQREGSRFELDGAPKRYDRETIFELLDGGADALIDEGLVSLHHVRVSDRAQVFTDAEIQVMDVGSPEQARAMLRKEKSQDAKGVTLGDEAFSEKGSVLFAKGRHLVRVMALPLGSRRLAPVEDIARQIEGTPQAAW